MAAVIGGIYNRAEQAAVNSINARQLLDLVKECDRQLAKFLCLADKQQGGLQVLHAATQGMLTMAKLIEEAGNVIASYNQHGFLMRAIMSNSHKAEFERLDADIRAAMQVIVSELEALSAELEGVKSDIADVRSQIAQLQESQDMAAARGPVALPMYLQTWWKDTEHVYLHCVVMPLMDKDEDGYVGLPELLEALFLGFDRKQATKKLAEHNKRFCT
ncbi:hypothetical protein HaLaN_04299, partial [Haematococcus lacustris]